MDQPPVPPARNVVYRLRWWLHLLLLTLYPLSLGFIGYFARRDDGQSMLPTGTADLLLTAGVELIVFAVVFAVASIASRPQPNTLLLNWGNEFRPVWRGFAYSILLRVGLIAMSALLALLVYLVSRGAMDARYLQPETENVVNARALLDPIYLLLTLTVISFVVAGLREELWRAGMLAGLQSLFPQLFLSRGTRLISAGIVAVVFGLGHVTQGVGGVIMTTALGFGLGVIMLRHRSIWEAVFAHGFFDATTFGLMYLMARFRPEFMPEGGL